MSNELKETILNIINSGNIIKEAKKLPLNDKITILDNRNRDYLITQILTPFRKNNVKLISKEESSYICKHLDEFDDFILDKAIFSELMDFSDDFDVVFRSEYLETRNRDYLYFMKDPLEFMDGHYYFWEFFSDDVLEKAIKSRKYNSEIENIVSSFKSDELKDKYLGKVKYGDRIGIIETFNSDEYKEKNLRRIMPMDRADIIASFESEDLKKEYLSPFVRDKYKVICTFKSDNDKIEYLNRNKLSLSSKDKGEVLASISDVNLVKENITLLKSEKDLVEFLSRYNINNDREFFLRTTELLRKEESLYYLFNAVYRDREFGSILLSRIHDNKDIEDIFERVVLNENIEEYINIIIPKLDEYQIRKYIKNNQERINYRFLLNCEDEELVFESLVHNNTIKVEYNDDLKGLFDIVARKYRVNRNHLIKLAKISDCSILKLIDNDNIRRAVNLNDADFEKYLKTFNINNYDMTSSSLASVVTALLQHEFSLKFPEEIQIFTDTLHFIEDKNNHEAYYRVNKVFYDVNTNYNISLEYLYEGLLNNDSEVIKTFNKMTNEYIMLKRNAYVNENLEESLLDCADYKYEKNDLLKFVFKNTDVNFINMELEKYVNRSDTDVKYKEFFTKKDLINKLISFRKNPESFGEMTKELKENIGLFNELCYIAFNDYMTQVFKVIPDIKKNYVLDSIDKTNLIEIMSCIDTDKLRDVIFKDEELFNNLIYHLEKYDMLGWENKFEGLAFSSDVEINSSVISSIISNFNIISRVRGEKESEGQSFNLISELNLASCLYSDADIYSILLGEEDYGYIRRNPSPNASPVDKTRRLKEAIEYLVKMHEKKFITVPTINENIELKSGKEINVLLGNTNDPINLTYGERTGACTRIFGAGHSLFEFCLTDENGFVISFNDPYSGAFVSRISCFRNGNTLFMNQLRDSVSTKYTNDDLIEALKVISKELIEKTKNSKYPIENIIASNGYALSHEKVTTVNISGSQKGLPKFYKDVSSDTAVIIATSGDGVSPIRPNPSATDKYPTLRSKIRKYESEKASSATKRIEALDMLYSGLEVDDISLEDRDLECAYVGEDWFVAKTKTGEIIKYVQKNSFNTETALSEMENYERMLEPIKVGGKML